MKKRNSQNQLEGKVLKVGDRVLLKVGINPKTGKPGFIPQFMQEDNLLAATYVGFGSIRIFIPNDQTQLEDGEIWNVKIISHHVSSMENMTKDLRMRVYINVEALARDERIIKSLDLTDNILTVKKFSGTKILAEKQIPLNIKNDGWYRKNGSAVQADIIYAADKAVDLNIIHKFSLSEFSNYWQKKLQKALRPKAVKKLFDSYPPLPANELEKIII
jgi:hypothetical protein